MTCHNQTHNTQNSIHTLEREITHVDVEPDFIEEILVLVFVVTAVVALREERREVGDVIGLALLLSHVVVVEPHAEAVVVEDLVNGVTTHFEAASIQRRLCDVA